MIRTGTADWLYAILLSAVFMGTLVLIASVFDTGTSDLSLPVRMVQVLGMPAGFLTALLIGERHPGLVAVVALMLTSLVFYTLCFRLLIAIVRRVRSGRGPEPIL